MKFKAMILILVSAFAITTQAQTSGTDVHTQVEAMKQALDANQALIDGFKNRDEQMAFRQAILMTDLLTVEKIQAAAVATDSEDAEMRYLLGNYNERTGRLNVTLVIAQKSCVLRLQRMKDAYLCGMMESRGTTISYSLVITQALSGKLVISLVAPIGYQG